jgi:hypothetical protein
MGFAGDPFVPAVNPAAWEMLNLSDQDIRDVLANLEDAIASLEDVS